MTDLPQPGSTTELVCIRGGFDGLLATLPPTGPNFVIRTGTSRLLPVEGELFTVEAAKTWVFGHTRYLKGEIKSVWLDVDRLELEPLQLHNQGQAGLLEDLDDLPDEVVAEIKQKRPRDQYEMEQVVPKGAVKLQWEEDPILEAVALGSAGYTRDAAELLGKLLAADLRCLDAYAHLGSLEFRSTWPGSLAKAQRHYQAGVAVGQITLGKGFDGAMPWGLLDNRPYLRCLHGLGICSWRQGDLATALDIFRRLQILNPTDNQGARFLWTDVQAGRSWEEATADR